MSAATHDTHPTPPSADAHGHAGAPGHAAHGHGHDDGHGHHDPAADARVVATIVVVLALGAALGVGLVSPQVGRPRPTGAPTAAPAGPQGLVVLTDGRVLTGVVVEDRDTIHVRDADGERVIPRRQVRWARKDAPALTEEYWVKHGGEPLAPEFARTVGGGGVVVLASGQVLVGRLAVGEQTITIRWPYKDQPFAGELTVPRDAVRWLDAAHDTLTDDYWRKFPDAPIDLRRQGGPPTTPDAAPRQGSQAPQDQDRAEAQVAMAQGRWLEAVRRWSAVTRRTGLETDLINLRRCVDRALKAAREDAEEVATGVDEALASLTGKGFVGIEELRSQACELGLVYHLTRRELDDSARWARRMETLGPAWAVRAKQALDGIAEIRRKDAEEAAEGQDGHEGHDHGPERR